MKRHYHLKSRFMNIMVWLVGAREPILVFTPWSCRTRLVPFFIRQLQAMEQSSQNLSFHNVHSLVPLLRGCNFSFYIATNCLAKILFQFSDCSLCQSSISSIHWFSVLLFHWGFLKFRVLSRAAFEHVQCNPILLPCYSLQFQPGNPLPTS